MIPRLSLLAAVQSVTVELKPARMPLCVLFSTVQPEIVLVVFAAMRRILIERARARNALKRGGDRGRVELRDDAVATDPGEGPGSDAQAEQLIALDAALEKLKELDERAVQVVMLRYFTGLSIEQTASAMGISPATVKKLWVFARAWLNREIGAARAE